MQETTQLAGLIQERLNETIAIHRSQLAALGTDAEPLLNEALTFLSGGKRFRAQFTILGYQAITPIHFDAELTQTHHALLDAACALELFHAAALIHDDVIDRSDTRRGRPAAHRLFAALHRANHWKGAADHFGIAGAILLGDLLQSWADELFQIACDTLSSSTVQRARIHFNTMRSEVAVGQYLDVVEEQQPSFAPRETQLERSTRILVYKSAKYSVESPLLIGASLAGASDAQEETLTAFGIPVGVAYQLRDDLLGVFGDETLTGKPSGDDLTEGKRTVLVTLARDALPLTQQRIFDELFGTEMGTEQIHLLQETLAQSGAVEEIEEMISRNVQHACEQLKSPYIHTNAANRLVQLAQRAARRNS